MERASQARLTTAVILVLVFGSGLLIGFAADGRLDAEPVPAMDVGSEPEAGTDADERREPRRGTYLSRLVDPTDEQLDMIDSIVAVHQERASALDKAHRSEMRGILSETRESIKSVLDPERAAAYQRHYEEYLARREAERESRDEGR